MSARQNYGFERRRKADAQRAKQEEKRQRKSERETSGSSGPEMGEAGDAAAPPPGMWEWFSPSRARTVTVAENTRPPADAPDDWVLLTDVPPEAQLPS
jgi:hypothetical protein